MDTADFKETTGEVITTRNDDVCHTEDCSETCVQVRETGHYDGDSMPPLVEDDDGHEDDVDDVDEDEDEDEDDMPPLIPIEESAYASSRSCARACTRKTVYVIKINDNIKGYVSSEEEAQLFIDLQYQEILSTQINSSYRMYIEKTKTQTIIHASYKFMGIIPYTQVLYSITYEKVNSL